MTKEIHDINTKALDFVVELIEYLFTYIVGESPIYSDYVDTELLCRKLYKYGFIDKKDGEWIVADRKTEPQTDIMTDVAWQRLKNEQTD